MRTGISLKPARCAARQRRAPVTISKCPFTRRTTSGESTPLLRMLSASSSSRSSSNALRGFVLDSINSTIGTLTYSFKDFIVSVVLISFLLFFESLTFLVVIGQKNRGEFTVSFGNDPQLFACGRLVGTQEPETMFQAQGVFLSVLFVEIAPISANMAFKKPLRCVPRPLQSPQCTRSGDDSPQSEKREFGCFIHR